MKISESALRMIIRETLLRETFAGYAPGKDELDKMPVGKKVKIGTDPSLPGTSPFVKKIGPDLYRADADLTLNDVMTYLSPAAKTKPEYSSETLMSSEAPINIPNTDIDPKYAKYAPTGVKITPLGSGEFKDVTQLNTTQLIDVMKAYIDDNRNWRFEII